MIWDIANDATSAIILDLASRCGLRQEWAQCEPDVREEIRKEWQRIIIKAIFIATTGREDSNEVQE